MMQKLDILVLTETSNSIFLKKKKKLKQDGRTKCFLTGVAQL